MNIKIEEYTVNGKKCAIIATLAESGIVFLGYINNEQLRSYRVTNENANRFSEVFGSSAEEELYKIAKDDLQKVALSLVDGPP
jgi:hypothetical protein